MAVIVFLSSTLKAQQGSESPINKNIQAYQTELKILGKQFSSSFYPNYSQFYRLQEKQFIHKIDSVRQLFNSVLDKYKLSFQQAYIIEQRIEIKYYFDKLLIDYPANHNTYSEKSSKHYLIPKRLQDNTRDFNKPTLLENADVTNYVKAYLDYRIVQERNNFKYKGLNNQKLGIIWDLLPKYFSDEKCLNYWKYYFLSNQIENDGIKNIQSFYQDYLRNSKDSARLTNLMKIYKEDSIARTGHLIKTYKTVGQNGLDLHIFLPQNISKPDKYPVMIYFHGGSWSEGKPDWFFEACKILSEKGYIACAVEYRTYGRFGTLPFQAVMDAKSAIRWLRKNAEIYNIDTARIVASGNSAGGHMALCTALVKNWNEKTDDLRISAVPNLLLINAGVYDLTDENTSWIRRRLKDKTLVKEISPVFLTMNKLPNTLILHGSKDTNVPFNSAKNFFEKIKTSSNGAVEFNSIEGAGHFIWIDPKYSGQVANLRRDFLNKFGYRQ